jgi:predicted metal-binding membrane protein
MTAGLWILRRRDSERNAEHAVLAVSSLLFAASATLTIVWCALMSAMGGMLIPGGWTMSIAWMRMPGQTWARAATSLLGMWVVMMVAMMLPSLVPMLSRYREAVTSAAETRLGLHCSYCSAGLTAILLVMGVMDLRVMAVVTTAITAERLAPAGERMARAIGVLVVCAGVLLLGRAAGLQ